MGTGLADMAWTTALSLVLYSLSYLQAQDICCKIKIVSGTLADDQGLSGTYTLLRDAGAAPDEACANGCVYSRDGMEGDEYCFQAVAAGADIEDQECGAGTGATDPAGATDGATEPAGAQTTASSDELRQQAEDAAQRVEDNNNRIAEANQNIANAKSTTEAIDGIQEKLSPTATTTGRRRRQKRQDSTDGPTPMPVEVPETCAEFGEAYKELLDLAAYVDVLINVNIEGLCDSSARETLATETNAKADAAIKSTKEYTDATKIKVTELKQKVNDDIALQESINEELEIRNEETVPVEASTHAIEPTTPSAEEENTEGGPETPEGTLPSEGETPEGTAPVEGETEESTAPVEGETPAGTPPVEGETPEGTPPAEGETPEGTPPVEGETPDGTPSMQISTAKPARMLFERKRRSRGSMF